MKLAIGTRLTERRIIEATAASGKDAFLWDGEIHGFGVRIRPSGTKSFILQYRTHSGRERRVTIEKVGAMTLEEARKRARQLKGKVADGGDPKRDRDALRAAPTFKDLEADYLTKHAIPKKRPSSVANDKSMLRDHITPVLGAMKVADITRDDIDRLHQQLKATPYRANRLLSLISKMMNLSVEWGWRSSNPAQRIKKFPEAMREPNLSPDDEKRLVDTLSSHSNRTGVNAVWMLLMTGSRKTEVLEAKWSEFNLDTGVWTKPSHRTKQNKTEHFPLSEEVLGLLKKMWADAPEEATWLFPGEDPEKPYGGFERFWRGVRKAANLPTLRVHDLRHHYASMLVRDGVPLTKIGKLLGHSNPLTTNRYAHHSLDDLRAISGKVSKRLTAISGGTSEDPLPEPVATTAA